MKYTKAMINSNKSIECWHYSSSNDQDWIKCEWIFFLQNIYFEQKFLKNKSLKSTRFKNDCLELSICVHFQLSLIWEINYFLIRCSFFNLLLSNVLYFHFALQKKKQKNNNGLIDRVNCDGCLNCWLNENWYIIWLDIS